MRTRDLKPAFWTDEKIVALTDSAKLLYQGLWMLADREGKLEDSPTTIGFQIRPWAPQEVPTLLGELIHLGRVVRYTSHDGRRLLWLPKLPDHQRFHPKEKPRGLPSCGESMAGVNPGAPQPQAEQPKPPVDRAVSSEPSEPSVSSEVAEKSQTPPKESRPPPLPKAPDNPFASPEAFFAHVQQLRHEHGFLPEKLPNPGRLRSFWYEVGLQLGGDYERLGEAYGRFTDDAYWKDKTPPWPFNAFITEWSRYVSRAKTAANG